MADEQDRLADALEKLGWSSQQLARHLGIRENTVRGWLSGRRSVPPNVLDWIERKAAAFATVPDLPEGWHPRGDC
jgi:transcriptional regulator with XRE-family HTH domain